MLPALMRLTAAHRTTAARWCKRQRLPRAVALLIELVWFGRLERIHVAWTGWRLDAASGALITPAGEPLTPGELIALPLRYQEIRALRRRLDELAHVAAHDRENREHWRGARDRLITALTDLGILEQPLPAQFRRGRYGGGG